MKLKYILLVVGTLLTAAGSNQASARIIRPIACGKLGDHLRGAAEAQGRREWAWKCFPDFRSQILLNDKWIDKKGGKVDIYPVLSFVDNENGDSTNPNHWFAPTDPSASCDVPAGYTIVTYCPVDCDTPEQN